MYNILQPFQIIFKFFYLIYMQIAHLWPVFKHQTTTKLKKKLTKKPKKYEYKHLNCVKKAKQLPDLNSIHLNLRNCLRRSYPVLIATRAPKKKMTLLRTHFNDQIISDKKKLL